MQLCCGWSDENRLVDAIDKLGFCVVSRAAP